MTPAERENPQVLARSTGTPHFSTAQPEPGRGASPAEIEEDLARTRRELGETVGALAGKLDVKSQAREQIEVSKHRITEQTNAARQHAASYLTRVKAPLTDEQGRPNMNAWIIVGALAATAALVLASRVRR